MIDPWNKQTDMNYRDIPVFGKQMTKEQRLEAMVWPMIHWYQHHARALPWRQEKNAYRTWISEIMLQQTRVEAVKPYFARFMETLPDMKTLADVEEEKLLKLWEGLGYYSRARNLKKCAVKVMDCYNGSLPADFEELKKLPGIGSYTAGAIASIAYGLPVPAVDGNVMRVVTRVLGDDREITKPAFKKELELSLRNLLENGAEGKKIPSDIYNQSLMEVGALICLPNGEPLCDACPLRGICQGRQEGDPLKYPVKAKKKPRRIEKRTVFRIRNEKGYFLHRRKDSGLLAGLYEFPNQPGWMEAEEAKSIWEAQIGECVSVEPLGDSKHIFTHIEWHMTGYDILIPSDYSGELFWEEETLTFFREDRFLKEAAIPSAFRAYIPSFKA